MCKHQASDPSVVQALAYLTLIATLGGRAVVNYPHCSGNATELLNN